MLLTQITQECFHTAKYSVTDKILNFFPRKNTFWSVQFSHSVMSDSLQAHEAQHARPPCPSPTPGVHLTMSIESVMPYNHHILCRPLLLLPSIFPSIRVFYSELAVHITDSQSTGVSASKSVIPMKTQD